MRFLVCLVSLLVLAGCGGGGGGSASSTGCGALNARVYNGETCAQDTRSPVVVVVALAASGDRLVGASVCTGALVTIDDVLTSAHCLLSIVRNHPGSEYALVVRAGGEDGENLFVSNLAVHPLYDGAVGSPFDLAMLTLENVPSPAIGPIPLLQSREILVGDAVTAFGYGTSNDGEIGVLKAAEIQIEAISGGNLFGSLATSDAALCGGDSGGPVVKQVNGVTALVGVNSFNLLGGNCSSQGAPVSGMIDIQFPTVIDFITTYAPDVPVV